MKKLLAAAVLLASGSAAYAAPGPAESLLASCCAALAACCEAALGCCA